MTIEVISASDCINAWAAASRHLAGKTGTDDNNLIVSIDDPVAWRPEWFAKIDPRTVHVKGENPGNVANTIFPLKTWTNSASRSELYERYSRAHRMGTQKRWGTYFLRLIDFGTSHVNQLERAIDVLNGWEKEPGTAIVFHVSSAETDVPRPLGGPCLQLCQLHAQANRIDMTSVYRNQDYFNKALPNFVGLGRLLGFICDQTGRSPGKLVCHSGHAYSSKGKAALVRLMGRL